MNMVAACRAIKNGMVKGIRTTLRFWPTIAVMVFAFILYLYEPIPNFLSIAENRVAMEIAAVITVATASMLAILVAVVLFALQTLRLTQPSYAYRSVIENVYFEQYLMLLVLTVIASFLALSLSAQPVLIGSSLNVLYLAMGLAILCFILLYPFLRLALSPSRSKREVKQLVESLSLQSALLFTNANQDVQDLDGLERHPLFLLNEMAEHSIRAGDQLVPRLIATTLGSKLTSLLSELTASADMYEEGSPDRCETCSPDRPRQLVVAFVPVYRSLLLESLGSATEGTFLTSLRSLDCLHHQLARMRVKEYWVIELDQLLEDVLNRAVVEGSRHTGNVLSTLQRICVHHLQYNCPKEDPSWLFPVFQDPDAIDQWIHLSTRYTEMISRAGQGALEARSAWTVSASLRSLLGIADAAISLEELGDKERWEVVVRTCRAAASLLVDAVKRDLHREARSVFLTTVPRVDTPCTLVPLLELSHTLIEIASLGRLADFTSELDALARIGRAAMGRMNGTARGEESAQYRDAAMFVIRAFNRLRETIAADLTDANCYSYLQLHERVQSLDRHLTKLIPRCQETNLRTTLSEALESFDQVERARAQLGRRRIEWPD